MRHRIAAAGTCCCALRRLSSPRRRRRSPPPHICAPAASPLDAAAAARFAALALKCLHQEYPNHISHTLNSAADVRAPHELTPAFYGCLDWHSDVHGHWLLVRLLRLYPDAPFAQRSARRHRAAPHARQHRRRDCLPARRRPRLVRASLRTRVAVAAGGGAAALGRCGRAALVRDARPARNRGGRTPRELAAEAALSDPHRRARPDRLLLRPHLGLGPGARATRSCARCSAMRRSASTGPIAPARSPTSPRARTSSRHAWRRRTSCGACCRRRSSRAGCPASCRRSRTA